jgi:superfamily II DNA or RNA helicase
MKTSAHPTLSDRLSQLSYEKACKLLGPSGARIIDAGAKIDIDVDSHIRLGEHELRATLEDVDGDTVVRIRVASDRRAALDFACRRCRRMCAHIGAVVALVLEEKLALGLSVPPEEQKPPEHMTDEELEHWALAQRLVRAREEKLAIQGWQEGKPWTDYTVLSAASGKTYRVALRGSDRGESYCSCPDFRKNTLGTCKHILSVLGKVKERFSARALQRPYLRTRISVHVKYGQDRVIWLRAPDERLSPALERAIGPLRARPVSDPQDLVDRIRRLESLGQTVTIYPDAEEALQRWLLRKRLEQVTTAVRQDPARHPLRKTLLKVELLPYQLDGVAFLAGAGRAVLADDMGLGKTIQAIGTAELLAREAGIRKVLVVCPASVKAQWRNEVRRFCDRDVQIILGPLRERERQYVGDCFFTVCNYEQVMRDLLAIEKVPWDLIVLDEAQRIKNWEARTTRVIKALRSPFAVALSGTPLENRLDELHSVVEFIDDGRLPPAFRFFQQHRVVNEKGRVLGYKNLSSLRARLAPVLLRRTRASVMQQLPPRSTEIVRITPTAEQQELHDAQLKIVATIARKTFVSEMDLLRLRKALLMCRMAADSTFLVDKSPPGHSSKLEILHDLLDRLLAEDGRKIVLYSEWTTMLDLIEDHVRRTRTGYVRLDGGVPQKIRQPLVHRFQTEAACRIFLASNAGATGLNLQAANTVVNVDLPWNPAILEQRIGRAHRMGQTRPVQAFLLVTENTLEENLLALLSAKNELASAALDVDSAVDGVDVPSGIEELRRRLEILLGAKPEAPVDQTDRARVEAQAAMAAPSDRIAEASGKLLAGAFELLDALLPATAGVGVDSATSLAASLRDLLRQAMRTDESGRTTLAVTLPSEAVDKLAHVVARVGQGSLVPATVMSGARQLTN